MNEEEKIQMHEEALSLLERAEMIYVAVNDFGRSRTYGAVFPYFTVWVRLPGEKRLTQVVDPMHPYYSSRKHAYEMNVYGTDRVFEVIYHFNRDKSKEFYEKTQRLF
jgi:hypothetical protein